MSARVVCAMLLCGVAILPAQQPTTIAARTMVDIRADARGAGTWAVTPDTVDRQGPQRDPAGIRSATQPVRVSQGCRACVDAAYEAVRTAPASAVEWSRLGAALREGGRPREAIAAFERALQLGAAEPHRPALDVARTFASLHDRRQTLRWVGHAVQLGLTDPRLLLGDPALAPYRDEARFREIVESIGAKSRGRVAERAAPPFQTGR